jgi:hypothetical protein
VTAAEDAAEARMPRFPRRPIYSRHRCGRSPLLHYLPLANMPIDPNRLYDIVILGSRRPASVRLRSRHKPYESSLHPPSTAERSVTSV